jgi:hypothetical protein
MIDGLEILYQQIVDSIKEAIPEPWSSAKVEAIFFSDSIDFETEYVSETGKFRGFATTMAGDRAFKQLRRRFKEAGKPVWGQACFELQSDGTFSMKWGYENCDANGDTIFDEETWSRRHEERRQRLSRP